MTSLEAHQALLQPHGEEQLVGFRNETQIRSMQNLNLRNHLKSCEILKSALKSFTSNTKFMFIMILSTLPLFVFMVLYEIMIPEVLDAFSKFLIPPYFTYSYHFDGDEFDDYDENDPIRKLLRILLELFPFYLVFLPLLELFSLPVIMEVTAKIYAGEIGSSLTLKETVIEVFNKKNSLKGLIITSLWVQSLSVCTLSGLFSTVASHHYIVYYVFLKDYVVQILSMVFYAVCFFGLLYKYLEWSALWNMAMVISVLQRDTGPYALELSAYYGKHCKRTGFQLMLIFFAYSVVLRLPFLLARMFDYGCFGVISATVIGLVCLGSLVKWVALVLYFYDCKAQMLSKKADDEEVGKAVNLC